MSPAASSPGPTSTFVNSSFNHASPKVLSFQGFQSLICLSSDVLIDNIRSDRAFRSPNSHLAMSVWLPPGFHLTLNLKPLRILKTKKKFNIYCKDIRDIISSPIKDNFQYHIYYLLFRNSIILFNGFSSVLELQGCEGKRVTVYCRDASATSFLKAKRTTDWVLLPLQKESRVYMLNMRIDRSELSHGSVHTLTIMGWVQFATQFLPSALLYKFMVYKNVNFTPNHRKRFAKIGKMKAVGYNRIICESPWIIFTFIPALTVQ